MKRLIGVCGSLALVSGCAAVMGVHQVPLVNSSLDMNKGVPHAALVRDAAPEDVVKKVLALAEKREYLVVTKSCEADACAFELKSKAHELSKTVGSGHSFEGTGRSQVATYNVSFASRIFGSAKREADGVRVEMVGVPVINNTPSCPPVLEHAGHCKPELFNVQGDQTPAQSFKGIWGEDISGATEAEVITGIFAELQ
jgi:hypothetical protein